MTVSLMGLFQVCNNTQLYMDCMLLMLKKFFIVSCLAILLSDPLSHVMAEKM